LKAIHREFKGFNLVNQMASVQKFPMDETSPKGGRKPAIHHTAHFTTTFVNQVIIA
jgi:hypothetical protein